MGPRRWELLSFAVLALATAVATRGLRPLAEVDGHRDTAITAAVMAHLQAAFAGEVDWRAAPLAWPVPDGITQSDLVFGQALLGWPLPVEPLVASNLVGLAGLFLSAWACHGAATALLGRGPHTWVAGIVGGLGPAQLAHLHHVNLVHHEVGIVSATLLGVGLHRARPVLAGLGGALVGVGLLFGAYVGQHGALMVALVLAAAALGRWGSARSWAAAALGLGVGLLAVWPVARVWLAAAEGQAVWLGTKEIGAESWDPATTLAPLHGVWAHAWLGDAPARLDPANPGWLAALLAGLGLFRGRARLLPVLVVLFALLLALGPTLVWNGGDTGIPGPYRLLQALPGGAGLRAPARWLAVAWMGVGLLAAAGVRSEGGVRRRFAFLAPFLLLVETPGELGAGPPRPPHPVYERLAELPAGAPIYDSAIFTFRGTCGCTDASAIQAGLHHGHPLVGGVYARTFDALDALNTSVRGWPDPTAAQTLAALGVRATIEHPPWEGSPPEGARCAVLDRHRYCALSVATPMPAAVDTGGAGPVVGARFGPQKPNTVLELRCDEQTWRTVARPWQAFTWLRHGRDAGYVDVFLPTACTGRFEAEGAPLHAAGTAGWPASPDGPAWGSGG